MIPQTNQIIWTPYVRTCWMNCIICSGLVLQNRALKPEIPPRMMLLVAIILRPSSFAHLSCAALLCLFAATSYAQDGNRKNAKDSETWSAAEYSGLRGKKEVRTAMASKGFTWITGSPADNEKLSIGKNAQFFGFVALRYQSGRAGQSRHSGPGYVFDSF